MLELQGLGGSIVARYLSDNPMLLLDAAPSRTKEEHGDQTLQPARLTGIGARNTLGAQRWTRGKTHFVAI